MSRVVGVNDQGRRVGQSHPRAEVTDRQVQLALELKAEGWSYRRVAEALEVSKACVAGWVKGRRRACVAVEYREVVG